MSKVFAFTAVAAAAVLGYTIYFDYNRRNSATFRKSLRKKNQKFAKVAEKADAASKQNKLEEVKKVLAAELEANPIPTDLSEKENFFMQQVALGEQLATLPDKKTDSAICFYKALCVYPNPTDILGIYQRSVPEDVYELVVIMIAIQPPAAVTNMFGGAAAGGVAGASANLSAQAEAAEVPVEKPSEADLD